MFRGSDQSADQRAAQFIEFSQVQPREQRLPFCTSYIIHPDYVYADGAKPGSFQFCLAIADYQGSGYSARPGILVLLQFWGQGTGQQYIRDG